MSAKLERMERMLGEIMPFYHGTTDVCPSCGTTVPEGTLVHGTPEGDECRLAAWIDEVTK